MIGLNEKLLSNYVEWVANRRMKAIGLDPIYDVPAKNNPYLGQSIGSTPKAYRLLLRKQRSPHTSMQVSNRT